MDNQTTPKTHSTAHKVGTAAGTIALATAGLGVSLGGLGGHAISYVVQRGGAPAPLGRMGHTLSAGAVIAGVGSMYGATQFYKNRRKPME